MINEPELLTIDEAAELLRAPVATLRWWRHNGTGPHSFKLGRHVMYRHADIDSWIEQRIAAAHRDNVADAEGGQPGVRDTNVGELPSFP